MIQSLFPTLGNAINSLTGIVEWINTVITTVKGVFNDINFTVLYSWFPADIAGVITTIIVVLLFLALFGIIRRILFFLG